MNRRDVFKRLAAMVGLAAVAPFRKLLPAVRGAPFSNMPSDGYTTFVDGTFASNAPSPLVYDVPTDGEWHSIEIIHNA